MFAAEISNRKWNAIIKLPKLICKIIMSLIDDLQLWGVLSQVFYSFIESTLKERKKERERGWQINGQTGCYDTDFDCV